MSRPQPTRLAPALALLLAGVAGCQRTESQAAPPLASTAVPTRAASAPSTAPAPKAPTTTAAGPSDAIDESQATPVPSASGAKPQVSPAESAFAVSARRPTRVLVLGDSLSDEKVGGGRFVRFLRERCPSVEFDNRAKGGFMLNQIRRKLEKEVLPEAGQYSHAIVFGGVNDLYSDQTAHRTLTRIESDLTAIYAALRTRDIDVIAITVTPWGGFSKWWTPVRSSNTQALNDWILSQARQGEISAALDAYPLLSCGVPTHLCARYAVPFNDGLHFGKAGHEVLGQALYDLAFRDCSG
jgi:lysophospholipase L1-like esterase